MRGVAVWAQVVVLLAICTSSLSVAQSITWTSCTLRTFDKSSRTQLRSRMRLLEDEEDDLFIEQAKTAECGTMQAPLDHSNPSGETIEIFVKKIPAQKQPATGQLWFFTGGIVGPGYGGIVQETVVEQLRRDGTIADTLDIFIPDQRGSGRSTRLGCPTIEDAAKGKVSQDKVPECLAELQQTWPNAKLAHFSSDATARDYKLLMDANPPPSLTDVFTYASGYGTFLLNRFMTLYPNVITHAVLDNVCPPGLCRLDQTDKHVNDIGLAFVDRCKYDDLCLSKLGNDPVKFIKDVQAKMRNENHCSVSGINADIFDNLNWLFMGVWWTRMYATSTAYRINRCSDEDVEVLKYLMNVAIGPAREPEGGDVQTKYTYSEMLHRNIAYSELWQPITQSAEQFNATESQYIFTSTVTKSLYEHQDAWPKYSSPSGLDSIASPSANVVVLAGDLDMYSPVQYAEKLEREMRVTKLNLVVIATAGHETINESPQTFRQDYEACGLAILKAYLKTKKVDVSCTRRLEPLDYAGQVGYNKNVYNTRDAYEGAASASHTMAALMSIVLCAMVGIVLA